MQNDYPSLRNKTLPIKDKHHSGSASKIKISKKGLPKDFFQPQIEQYFMNPSQIRCKTQNTHNQLKETSYFKTLNPSQPKRQGRQYKSQQRKRVSKKRLHQDDSNKNNESFIMNCTFFKSKEQQGETLSTNKQTQSNKICNKAYYHQQSQHHKHLQISTNKEELNSIFKARGAPMFQLGFHRLKVNGSRGPLPLIRLNKRMII